MYITAGQGQTAPGDKVLMSTETSYHFGHLLQVSKQSLCSLILYTFFMILNMYIAPEQEQTAPRGHSFDVNRNILSLQSFVESFKKISQKSDFIPFFHDFIHVYSLRTGADTHRGQRFDVNSYVLSLLSFAASLKKKCLWSLILYNFFFSWFNTCRQPPGDKILMSAERPYHFTHLLQVSKKSLWSLILYNFFHDLIHVYSPGTGGIQSPGDKVLMSTETSCQFGYLLLVSNHRRQ